MLCRAVNVVCAVLYAFGKHHMLVTGKILAVGVQQPGAVGGIWV